MSNINLDIRAEVNIKAVKGDDFGPLYFIFKNADGTLQNLAGAAFGCAIKNMQGTIVHELKEDDDEIIFNTEQSKLTIFIDKDVTATFNQGTYSYTIKQTLNDLIITRLFGTIIFKK